MWRTKLSQSITATTDMIADYFTKPLQGTPTFFVKLYNLIMGAEYGDGNPPTHRSVLNKADGNLNMRQMEIQI